MRAICASLGASGHDSAEIALITEEGDHFIGELALLQSRVQWTLLDRSRVEDPSARLLFLAALTEVAEGRPPSWPPPNPPRTRARGGGRRGAPARGAPLSLPRGFTGEG